MGLPGARDSAEARVFGGLIRLYGVATGFGCTSSRGSATTPKKKGVSVFHGVSLCRSYSLRIRFSYLSHAAIFSRWAFSRS